MVCAVCVAGRVRCRYYNLICAVRRWKRGDISVMKVKTMLIIAASCFAIIPMIIYSVYASNTISSNSSDELYSQLQDLVSNQVQVLDTYLDTVQLQNEILVNTEEIQKAGTDSTYKNAAGNLLVSFTAENSSVDAAALVDSSGKLICGKLPAVAGVELDSLNSYKDNALYLNSGNKLMFVKNKIGSDNLIVFYKIQADTFLCKIPSNAPSAYLMMVVDSKLNGIAKESVVTNLADQYSQEVIDMVATLDDGVSGIINYEASSTGVLTGKGQRIAVMARVGGADGLAVIASCDDRDALLSSGATSGVIAATVIISIIAIVAAVIIAILVTRPLNIIEETLTKIRRGDHEARISTVSNNEYGQISRAFNNLVDEIVVSEDRYRTIIEMSDDIIFEWNFKTNEVIFSNNFNKKFSYRAPSDHFADSFLLKAKLHSDDADRYRSDLERLGNGEEFKGNEYRIKNIYGDFIWVLMRTATLRDKDGNPLKVVGAMVDIDRAKKSEQQLTARASYDALTELYNRETVESQINNEITLSEARKSEMAVLFVDVDDFKHFNDKYSHATGDQVLKFVARTVNNIVGEYGFAGRYGGDEFIACIRNAEVNDPARAAQDIIARLDEGFTCDSGDLLKVSVSIGIALIKDDYNTRVEYLIGKADDAMYAVKKSGKSNYGFI